MFSTADFKTRTQIIPKKSPCPEGYWVLGLDIGYSSVKGWSPNKIFCFPAYARKQPEGRIILKDAEETDIRYRDASGEWTVGSLAYDEVNASEVVDSESEMFGRSHYNSEMFLIQARTGIAIGYKENHLGQARGKEFFIQTGLPPKFMDDQEELFDVLEGEHDFEVKIGKGKWEHYRFLITRNQLSVMPQPLGAFVSVSMDSFGQTKPIVKDLFSKKVIVLDPGFGTTDDYEIRKGVVSKERSNSLTNLSMKEVFKRTCRDIRAKYNVSIDVAELQNYLAEGTIRVVDKKKMKSKTISFADILEKNCKDVCHETLEKMKRNHDYFADCDYVIGAGGTYDAWKDEINEMFREMDSIQIVPGNINEPELSNIYANVRGYYYYRISGINRK